MKYVSGRIVCGIYTWFGWSGEVAEPIGSSVPVRGGRSPAGSGGGEGVYKCMCRWESHASLIRCRFGWNRTLNGGTGGWYF